MDAAPLQSLIAAGTKLWLDSVDPDEVKQNRAWGATGATSNPIIIADIVKTGRFDGLIAQLIKEKLDDEAIAWRLTDSLVRQAQEVFLPVWEATKGDDGYVSFELDPLLEDVNQKLSVPERTAKYIELGKHWSKGHKNRMIKVPATPGGIGAMEELLAAGVTVNVTLIFSEEQYHASRDAGRNGDRRWPGSSRSTASSSAGWTCTRPKRCRSCRRRRRAWSASSTPSGFGSSTSSSGRTRSCR
jgi:transaldolase